MDFLRNPLAYFGKRRMNNEDLLRDALRNSLGIKGIVHWVAENPPESELKFHNGLYRMEGEVTNVACDGLYDMLITHMIAGAANATDATTELHLGDDTTTTPTRADTGVNSEIHSAGNLTNATGLTGVASNTVPVSFNDTFTISNTWTNTGSDDDAGEVAAMQASGNCSGHAIFVNPAVTISGSSGTLTINYKFIMAPA